MAASSVFLVSYTPLARTTGPAVAMNRKPLGMKKRQSHAIFAWVNNRTTAVNLDTRSTQQKKKRLISGHAAGNAVDSGLRSLSVSPDGGAASREPGHSFLSCAFTLPCVRERGTCSAFLQETAPHGSPGTLAVPRRARSRQLGGEEFLARGPDVSARHYRQERGLGTCSCSSRSAAETTPAPTP